MFKFRADVQWCSGVNMMAAPPILVLMILALHLQCLHTKYFLVDTISNDKDGSVKHLENPKHSAPRIKTSNKAAPIGPDDSWMSELKYKKSGLLVYVKSNAVSVVYLLASFLCTSPQALLSP